MSNDLFKVDLNNIDEIVLIYENCEVKNLSKEKITKLILEADKKTKIIHNLEIRISFEKLDKEFQFYTNRRDLCQIMIKFNDKSEKLYHLEYISENDNCLGLDNLLQFTYIYVEEKEVLIYYKYNNNKPDINHFLNKGVSLDKDFYTRDDISGFLIFFFGNIEISNIDNDNIEVPELYVLSECEPFQYGTNMFSVTEKEHFYILTLSNTINHLSSSILVKKDKDDNIEKYEDSKNIKETSKKILDK